MQNRIVSSLVYIIIGILFILFPLYILPVCPPETVNLPTATMHGQAEHVHAGVGKIMKCFWTGRAEIGVGSMIIAIGILMLFCRKIFLRMGLSMAVACISLFAAAIPTILIGVCSNEMMRCNMGAKPALVLLSVLLFIVSLVNIFYLNKAARRSIF
ncbi:DUF4418 family protein [Gilliamella sp. B2776]|uniref:DUF4418 family protein n=1 Tax=unclassified Gilliamella TaxID=2685620 RepID=UPI00226A39C8|nr:MULTISPECIES: DUF4418 family protein [unclassified Gilliamella]MCX8648964.1 DUF4418 family protein [Gilliamella sp. B2779]MCX8653160.1 DUF4418 family protein [Gilliamella sp. B2737]MCX8664185.1 DUF4418 family protein [Gilliamella sp. B2887]MCX8690776.1 DUF4418 family protein [Gilliamella sp. B2776]MCX8698687.1 DUF4418 family protein [Gilliamella sp. B3000]